MNRNIEIKAPLPNRPEVLGLLQTLADSGPHLLCQEDVFFHTHTGRLKLRTINCEKSELIYYQRPDQSHPKPSNYLVVPVPDPSLLREALTQAYGVSGVVRKRRTLFLIANTRVHLDEVEGLGDFLELEVVLPPDASSDSGIAIAAALMQQLHIDQSSLLSGSYLDLQRTAT